MWFQAPQYSGTCNPPNRMAVIRMAKRRPTCDSKIAKEDAAENHLLHERGDQNGECSYGISGSPRVEQAFEGELSCVRKNRWKQSNGNRHECSAGKATERLPDCDPSPPKRWPKWLPVVHGHEKKNEREHQPIEDRLQCQQEEGIGGELLFRQMPVQGWLNQRVSQEDEDIGGKQPDRHKGDEEEEIAQPPGLGRGFPCVRECALQGWRHILRRYLLLGFVYQDLLSRQSASRVLARGSEQNLTGRITGHLLS